MACPICLNKYSKHSEKLINTCLVYGTKRLADYRHDFKLEVLKGLVQQLLHLERRRDAKQLRDLRVRPVV